MKIINKEKIMNAIAALDIENIELNVWNKGDNYRIYAKYHGKNKGFVKIESDGAVNIDPVQRSAFDDMKQAVESAGFEAVRR